jgi:uridine kinase
VLVEPAAAKDLYIPFLDATVSAYSANPWSEWMLSGGKEASFPYGLAMYMTFFPMFLIGDLLSLTPFLSYFATILIVEFALLVALTATMKRDHKLITILFWLSPVNLVALYFYGFNDIVPVTFLFWSIYFLYKNNWFGAGVMIAFAVSAKVSMIIALPVVCLYFLNNSNLRGYINVFLTGFLLFAAALSCVYLWSPEAVIMLLGNPEVHKVTSFSIELPDRKLMVVPFIYLLFLYWIWRIRRINLEIVNALIGLSFLFFAMLFLNTPGWLLWAIPFLVIYQCQQRDLSLFLVLAFSCIFIVQVLFKSPVATSIGLVLEFPDWKGRTGLKFEEFDSLLVSFVVSLGGLIALRIFRQSIYENNFYRATRQPFVIGITGDSGTGKDTLAEAIMDVTGPESSVNISGDDYHKYDRSKGHWVSVTHLNPEANNLGNFAADIGRLKLRQHIRKRHYDHKTGKLSRLEKIPAKDFVIVSGLHTFSSSKLEQISDLRVYLDMDEDLRRYFKLQRDVLIRKKGVEETLRAMDKRRSDFRKYVVPQIHKAHIVFSLRSTQTLSWDMRADPRKLFLDVQISRGFDEARIFRVLVGTCNCQVSPLRDVSHNRHSFRISGYVSAETIELAAKSAGIGDGQLFDLKPKWVGGMLGVMQLVTLMSITSSMIAGEVK